jgi:hypothetical protein
MEIHNAIHGHRQSNPRVRKRRRPPRSTAPDRNGQVQRGAHEGWRPARPRWSPSQLQRRTETKELIAGFSILQVKSLEEAIEWVKRAPNCNPGSDSEVEIRQVFEMEDFAPVLSEEQIQHKVERRAELPNQTANK